MPARSPPPPKRRRRHTCPNVDVIRSNRDVTEDEGCSRLSLYKEGQSCVITNISPLSGLAAVAPQFDPPRAPGSAMVVCKAGGVKMPVRALAITFFQLARSCGVSR